MDSIRIRRVAELLKHEISYILANDVKDPRVHDVVITGVKVTADLSLARVYFSSYDKKSLKDLEIGLSNSNGYIRKKLKTAVHMKKLPQLVFETDRSPEEAGRLDELFRQISGENEGNEV
ncbi:MAG: 30S ribosome-binding factor RbfA [Deferribacteraceae bacterium]|jgi:ribosome-binding factor A|nr:30S ribosome-binding factor RbfA [Deferribacteraceae bacterium]